VSAPDLAPGTVVGGRYTVASRIGAGARSTTYRASNGGASEVALKVYDPALPASMVEVLRRAGEAAAAVTSAAIAPLDAGVDDASGAPFAVQELSARPSLAQLVELCPLAPADVVALARSLARALGPLHERGLAHGALAPTNVFVGPPPACEVRLSDFAAPAEARGPAEALATDAEGVARVVSFALTGRPFGSPGPQLDAAWGAAFRRAMHPREGEAYVSLDALADSLDRAARGEAPPEVASASASAWPLAPPPVPPAAGPPDRMARPWMIGLGAVACLVLAMCVAVAVKLAKGSSSPEPSAAPVAASEAPPLPSASPLASEETPAASDSASDSASVAEDNPPPPPQDEPALPPNDHWHALLVVTCKPSCDSVFVDGHVIAHADRGALIAPGFHTIAENLANHGSRVQQVALQRGRVKRLKISF
jgi:serine/threonine protein kinase